MRRLILSCSLFAFLPAIAMKSIEEMNEEEQMAYALQLSQQVQNTLSQEDEELSKAIQESLLITQEKNTPQKEEAALAKAMQESLFTAYKKKPYSKKKMKN